MKIKNTLLGLLAFGTTFTYAQDSVEFTDDDNAGMVMNGDTLVYTTTESAAGPHLHVENTGTAASFKWGRKVILAPQASYSDELCDDHGCYSCSGDYWELSGVFPSGSTLANGASSVFLPKVNFQNTGGDAHIRYYALTSTGVRIDSVDVMYKSTVSIGDNSVASNVAVFPNPVNDILNINVDGVQNSSIIVFDITGKNVANKQLVNGKNQLNVESLKAGIYFYSVLVNKEVIETKKIIVQ